MTSERRSPSDVVAARVREVRRARRLQVPELAERCAAEGFPELTAAALWNLEGRRTGKRPPRAITVDELLALAKVLQVHPVHLLVEPRAAEEPYQVTPAADAPAADVREWVRGYGFLPGDDRQLYISEVPPGEAQEVAGIAFPTRQPWQLRQMQRDQPGEESE
jgi:transcriptional regulator with XRE-family HTH domain